MDTPMDQLRAQFTIAHDWLRDTIADLTPEQTSWLPPGVANPIGGTLGHVLSGEDAMVHIALRGTAPLFATDFQDKTGMNPLHPVPGEGDVGEWMRTVEIDLAGLRAYSDAVRAATEAYLETLDAAEYDRSFQHPLEAELVYTVGSYLATVTLPHIIVHIGEIACLKGLQGAAGYNV